VSGSARQSNILSLELVDIFLILFWLFKLFSLITVQE